MVRLNSFFLSEVSETLGSKNQEIESKKACCSAPVQLVYPDVGSSVGDCSTMLAFPTHMNRFGWTALVSSFNRTSSTAK